VVDTADVDGMYDDGVGYWILVYLLDDLLSGREHKPPFVNARISHYEHSKSRRTKASVRTATSSPAPRIAITAAAIACDTHCTGCSGEQLAARIPLQHRGGRNLKLPCKSPFDSGVLGFTTILTQQCLSHSHEILDADPVGNVNHAVGPVIIPP